MKAVRTSNERCNHRKPTRPALRQSDAHGVRAAIAVAVGLGCAAESLGTVGPPVKIKVPETIQPAISGQEYTATIQVLIGRVGLLDDFALTGEGWTIVESNAPNQHQAQAGEAIDLTFKAVPADANRPLRVSLTWNGRRVSRTLRLSQAYFEQMERSGPLQRVDVAPDGSVQPVGNGGYTPAETDGPAAPQDGDQPEDGGAGGDPPEGGSITLHLRGRLGYTRAAMSGQPAMFVGADHVLFEVKDSDTGPDETIVSGFTDQNGFFDVFVSWDDCDIFGCDDPDLYVRFETDTDIVNVQEDNLLECDYSWSTEDNTIEDFTGTFVDFGTVQPANAVQHPALHINNSVVRAWRFVLTRDGTDIEELDVQWPDDEGTFYNPTFEEIHVGTDEHWNEGTITHEYGHHFQENYSASGDFDYCNGVCDTPDCTHCVWCPESTVVAMLEGWPDWFAGVVNRSYPADYGITPLSINDNRWIQDPLSNCDGGLSTNPLATEGFLGALCRDIEDPDQDNHNSDTIRDELCLGVEAIFQVVRLDQPTTSTAFIAAFRARFPQFNDRYVRTALNVDPSYASFGHSCCATGGPGCANLSVQSCVCATDPFCCNTQWDAQCVNEVTSLGCGGCAINNHGCCDSGNPGCSDATVRNCVCAQDPYCCNIYWDDVCVVAVNALGCGSCTGNHACNVTGGPGCNDPTTMTCVCNVDPFCCTNSWDGQCVDEVSSLGCNSCGPIPHGCCVEGGPGCSNMTIQNCVCAQDSFCCNTAWDGICVDEVDAFGCGTCGGCGPGNPNSCYAATPNNTTGCSNPSCCNSVCAADAFCCATAWDSLCAEQAVELCAGCGSSNPSSCYASHAGTGCNQSSCCSTVCTADPFCCETQWDGACAAAAQSICPLPSVSFTGAPYSIGESGSATITVTLSNSFSLPVTISYAASNGTAVAGSDYTATGGMLTWTPGQTGPRTFTVAILPDTLDEANETINLTLSSPVNCTIASPNPTTLTITDDDGAPSVSFTGAPYTHAESGSQTVTVTISNVSGQTVSVNYATSNGSASAGADYTAASGTLTWLAGQTGPRTFTVPILTDSLDEADETVNLTLSAPVNCSISAPNPTTLTITDDDAPPVISFVGAPYTHTESGMQTVMVGLSGPSGLQVSVNFATSNGTATAGSDYSTTMGSFTWNPGVSSNFIFNIPILPDSLDEANETINVTLSSPVNGTIGAPNPTTVTITDDDAPPVVSFSGAAYTHAESGVQAVSVTISAASGLPVSVDFATSNGTAMAGSDYTAANGSLMWNPGQTAPMMFNVPILTDTCDEPNETVNLTLSGASNCTIGTPNPTTITITDDDAQPTVAFVGAPYTHAESGMQTVTVSLTGCSSQTVTINYATSNGTATAGQDYTAASGTLTWLPGQTGNRTFDVLITSDMTDEPDETVNLTLSGAVNTLITGTNPTTLTILDDDVPGMVTLVSANPPLADANPHQPGQPFRDVLDTGTTNPLTAGIGGVGTINQGPIQYSPILVTFSGTPTPALAAANIAVTCTGGVCPLVTGVTGAGAGPYSITLDRPIPPGHCTTLMFSGSNFAPNTRVQYRSQPGNVSLDSTTNTQDMLTQVQSLNNGMANMAANLARYNVNRSAGANPVNTQDLLRLIQLLNGTNTTQAFNGATVAACP